MKLDELERLADEANVFCNKCGYWGKEAPTHPRCDYMATKYVTITANSLKQMIVLIRQLRDALVVKQEALFAAHNALAKIVGDPLLTEDVQGSKALAAFEKFDKGE